jgi:hypothetical protein
LRGQETFIGSLLSAGAGTEITLSARDDPLPHVHFTSKVLPQPGAGSPSFAISRANEHVPVCGVQSAAIKSVALPILALLTCPGVGEVMASRGACFVVIDSAGQKLPYVYFEDEPPISLGVAF